uniref:Glycoprotein M6B n=1 Tax=Macaca fascicularis TaxID=9541 RepID=A0A2K5WHX3_MACFA
MGCFECCIKCLGGVPYASLVATILCFSGVALFCGCGHVALAGTVAILEQHFSTNASDHALLSEVIQLMQYVIYGIASFFFLYGIILLAEGFYTTSAVKELHGEFKTTACGRCISGMFVFLTYVLGVAWLGVFGFSAVPVFMFYNIWSTCEVIKSPQTNGTTGVEQICVDIRQYGIIPWNAFPGKICGSALENICNTNEFYMSYHLFIVACAGAGATVIALMDSHPKKLNHRSPGCPPPTDCPVHGTGTLSADCWSCSCWMIFMYFSKGFSLVFRQGAVTHTCNPSTLGG